MSGVVKGVKKVFKKVGKAVKKLWKNKIVRAIVIAAAIYFTAGAAAAYFAAPAAGAAGTTAAAGSMVVDGVITAEALAPLAVDAAATAGTTAATTAATGAMVTDGVISAEALAPLAESGASSAAATAAGSATDAALAQGYNEFGGGLVEGASGPGVIPESALAPMEASPTIADANVLLDTPSIAQSGTSLVDSASLVSSNVNGSWMPKWFTDLPQAAQQALLQGGMKGIEMGGQAYMANEHAKDVQREKDDFQNSFNLPSNWANNVVQWKDKGAESKLAEADTNAPSGDKPITSETRTSSSQGAKPMKSAQERLATAKKDRDEDRRRGLVETTRYG